MAPSERTSPAGSATATTIFSESTSSPTYRISFLIGRLLSLVALRYGRRIASVTYGLAIGAGRPILTTEDPGRRVASPRSHEIGLVTGVPRGCRIHPSQSRPDPSMSRG